MKSKQDIENLFKHSKHFCVLPWVHLHATENGYMTPCCQMLEGPHSKGYGSLNEYSFPELWQGEVIRKMRLSMLADEKYPGCVNCYETENVNQDSFRKYANKRFRNYLLWVMNTDNTGYAPQAKPVYWDIRFSNICNLKCRTCCAGSSSSWYQDEKALGKLDPNNQSAIHSLQDPEAFLQDLKPYYSQVENIYFAGGEPLLFKENLALLEELNSMRRHKVELLYNTNMTQINPRFPELWKKFRKVDFLVSLDGSQLRGEYLRKGSAWEGVINNLHQLKKQCPHAKIAINFTVSAFNILHLPEFHKELIEKGLIKEHKIFLNILQHPDFYNVKVLPGELKKQATQKLQEHIHWLTHHDQKSFLLSKLYPRRFDFQFRACIDYMNSENWTHLIPQFIETTQQLDHLRNEDCRKVFPELAPVFDSV